MKTRSVVGVSALVCLVGLLVGLLVGGTGCATTSKQYGEWRVPEDSAASGTFEQWFEGELEPEDVRFESGEASGEEADGQTGETLKPMFDPVPRLAAAEMAYWDGDVERAFELYVEIVDQTPSHPMTRFAAARVYDLRDDVVDWRGRVEPLLRQTRYGQVHPLGRVYLSLVGQTVLYRNWKQSESTEPFEADGAGFPSAWRITPRLSPWRTLDFDRAFEGVEGQATLADAYLSPWYAEDRPVNRRRTTPFEAGGLSLSPELEGRGIFYLETFLTVDETPPGGGEPTNAARDFWVYGNFPGAARIWIDGRQLFERQLGNYGTGKRLRRIALKPGTHRVLVKLAYEPGYRDWFDLAFMADTATPLADSGVQFTRRPPEGWDGEGAGFLVKGGQRKPAELEPLLVGPEHVAEANANALYLTALASFYDHQPKYFEAAMGQLLERYPEFAAGWGLRSEQVQTLWEIPSDKRDARALAHLRKAAKYDEDSLYFMARLADWLRQRGQETREVRDLLEVAREGAVQKSEGGREQRLRNIGPLNEWASWLGDEGYQSAAEDAWARALEVAPTNCRAARALQESYYGRDYYPKLAEITPKWERCPTLAERLIFKNPAREADRLAFYRKYAARYPWSAGRQIELASELVRQGQSGAAEELLEEAAERMPWEDGLWNELAEMALAEEGQEEAAEVLKTAMRDDGASVWQLKRLSTLRNEIPLRDLLMDGKKVAMEHLEDNAAGDGGQETPEKSLGQSDEAYYVIDYAATRYQPDGTSRTLTHTMVRVMTKGAIDRFAEQRVPGGAELLRVRTINQDGTVQVPEATSGKSTLSMPGLDEGDFVEMAYLSHDSRSSGSRSHREGIRFFFRMSDISSLHSEYAVLGVDGAEFLRHNDPPKAETFESEAGQGVRFVRKDSPRPRREPNSVSGQEFLPWIQMYRKGVTLEGFEVNRRWVADTVGGSLEVSHALRQQVDEWRADTEPGTDAEVKDLFYDVAGWFNEPKPTGFSTDVSHALETRTGSPHLMLHAAYRLAGIPSQVYLVKSRYRDPETYEIGEFGKYGSPMVRAQMPSGEWVWLNPAHRDAMFETANLSTMGQPAVCVSCREANQTTVPEEGFRESLRRVDVTARLEDSGGLQGTATLRFHGVRAAAVRASLRRTPQTTRRKKFLDGIIASLLPGSALSDYRIKGEEDRDVPLVFEIDFQRPNFAPKDSKGVRRVQTALFREPVASGYAGLRTRKRPMMIGRQRETDYSLEMTLPEGWNAEIESKTGQWTLDSEYGEFGRHVRVKDGTVLVDSSLHLPIQRVGTGEYRQFRRWAVSVERSSRFLLTLEK